MMIVGIKVRAGRWQNLMCAGAYHNLLQADCQLKSYGRVKLSPMVIKLILRKYNEPAFKEN